jgi:hypothetical protein
LILWKKVLPVVAPLAFTAYLVYGFVRPHISRSVREEIGDEAEDDPGPGSPGGGGLS